MFTRKTDLPDPTEIVEGVHNRLSALERDRDFLVDLLLAAGLGILVLADVLTSGRR